MCNQLCTYGTSGTLDFHMNSLLHVFSLIHIEYILIYVFNDTDSCLRWNIAIKTDTNLTKKERFVSYKISSWTCDVKRWLVTYF